jgi:hypothetical protein
VNDTALDAQQREAIRAALRLGLDTDWRKRAYSDAEIRRVVDALQALAADDLEGRLRLAGFTLQPYVGEEDPEIEQSCSTCMYFEAHRGWCNLPELKLSVEPAWSCILWRV